MNDNNILDFHKKPKVYNHTDVMNHLNDPYKVEFEKDGENYYIVSKDDMESVNANIIGMMTDIDVRTGKQYQEASSLESVTDKPFDQLANFVIKHNLEGVMDFDIGIPKFAIYFLDQLFNAHNEIDNPILTAEGMPKGLHQIEYEMKDEDE